MTDSLSLSPSFGRKFVKGDLQLLPLLFDDDPAISYFHPLVLASNPFSISQQQLSTAFDGIFPIYVFD
ncbi:hypothetical protein EW145_g1708 [Phellinidium pouzarii]|uniref:Uncharacterized protein n=1 Tax=Phellinidium pouzarii TaxID=167371 RepID=A0A4S4LJ12_9AGAM|nr:hypothetical protein EW145_g1708 [Phellinidium pouzarii]